MREEEFQAQLKAFGAFTDSKLENLICGQSRDELLDGLVLFSTEKERTAVWRHERKRIMDMRGLDGNYPTPWGFMAPGFANGDRPEAWWRYDAPGAPIDPTGMSDVDRSIFLREHRLLEKGEEAAILAGPMAKPYAAALKARGLL
jgi:hypothetical protein